MGYNQGLNPGFAAPGFTPELRMGGWEVEYVGERVWSVGYDELEVRIGMEPSRESNWEVDFRSCSSLRLWKDVLKWCIGRFSAF